MKKFAALGALLLLISLPHEVSEAATITDLIGDNDGLGGRSGAFPGGTVPLGIFDNRSAAEMVATDGSQFTDRSTTNVGISLDLVDFFHTYDPISSPIVSATVTFGLAGVNSNDGNPSTKTDGWIVCRWSSYP